MEAVICNCISSLELDYINNFLYNEDDVLNDKNACRMLQRILEFSCHERFSVYNFGHILD